MKKSKLILGLSAAVLTLLFSIEGNAATGWTYENGNWYYYSKEGNIVTEEWQKDNTGNYYYLGLNGKISTSMWVDDMYYVDSNGVMLKNVWRCLISENPSYSDYGKEYWYYFDASGKKINETWRTIGGVRYHFNSEGKMSTGWLDETYYLGGENDGAMAVGWKKLSGPLGQYDTVLNQEAWYYFAANGTVFKPDVPSGAEGATRKIGGKIYAFDSIGRMLSGWVNVSDSESSSYISNYRYFGNAEDGAAKVGWQYIIAPKYVITDSWDDSYNWFYMDSTGKPRSSDRTENYRRSDLVTIEGKRYIFDKYGRVISGLHMLENELYYFGNENQCYMQTGRFRSLKEADGNENGEFFFITSGSEIGKGLTGISDNKLYYRGYLQKASPDEKYKVASIQVSNTVRNYLINTSGNVVKSARVKDEFGDIYETNSSGIVTKINGASISSAYEQGTELETAIVN